MNDKKHLTINEYLANSERVIRYAQEISKTDPQKACSLALEVLTEHMKLLPQVQDMEA